MPRLLLIAGLILGLTVNVCPADADAPPAHVANVQVVDIDVNLYPVLLVGMEVPVITVKVRNAGTAPSPAFRVSTRVSYYGTDATFVESQDAEPLQPGETRTFSFELRAQVVGVRAPHGITSIAEPFPGELSRIDNRRFEILDF